MVQLYINLQNAQSPEIIKLMSSQCCHLHIQILPTIRITKLISLLMYWVPLYAITQAQAEQHASYNFICNDNIWSIYQHSQEEHRGYF